MKEATEILLIVDRSGSMDDIKSDAIGGYNSFLADQQKLMGEAHMRVILFNQGLFDHYDGAVKTAVKFTSETYNPCGTTALYDAVGYGIDSLGAKLKALPEAERPNKVLVVILTDGMENSSQEYTRQSIYDKITQQRTIYNWEFVFLAANIDAFDTGISIGIKGTNCVNFDASSEGIARAYSIASQCATSYRLTGTVNRAGE